MARPRLDIELRGLNALNVNLSRWEAKKVLEVKELVKKTAMNIRRNARRRAPVKTGRLRKSIRILYGKDRLSAYVRAVAPYSHIVENGSSVTGASPRPFLKPAADGQVQRYEQEIRRIFEEV